MKWLIAFALLFSIPTADVTAQEVTPSALTSASSLSSAFREPQQRPRPQAINDDDIVLSYRRFGGDGGILFRAALLLQSQLRWR